VMVTVSSPTRTGWGAICVRMGMASPKADLL
jgi:hypothetical protein